MPNYTNEMGYLTSIFLNKTDILTTYHVKCKKKNVLPDCPVLVTYLFENRTSLHKHNTKKNYGQRKMNALFLSLVESVKSRVSSSGVKLSWANSLHSGY